MKPACLPSINLPKSINLITAEGDTSMKFIIQINQKKIEKSGLLGKTDITEGRCNHEMAYFYQPSRNRRAWTLG
jgi:hypothetical protein